MLSTYNFADHVLAVVLKTAVTESMINEMKALAQARLEVHKIINVYFEIEDGCEIPPRAMVQDLFFHFQNSGSFGKVAIVTNKKYIRTLGMIKNLLIDAEVKAFGNARRLEAMNWVL